MPPKTRVGHIHICNHLLQLTATYVIDLEQAHIYAFHRQKEVEYIRFHGIFVMRNLLTSLTNLHCNNRLVFQEESSCRPDVVSLVLSRKISQNLLDDGKVIIGLVV